MVRLLTLTLLCRRRRRGGGRDGWMFDSDFMMIFNLDIFDFCWTP
jgi:hypothetical protein